MDAQLVAEVGFVVAVLTILWVLPDWDHHRERAARFGQVLGVVDPPPPRPSGPPLEKIVADIRRIRAEVDRAPPGMPVARLRGWLEAYDDVLVTACRALDLEEQLSTLPAGGTHDLERERVERMLARAGLQVRLPR